MNKSTKLVLRSNTQAQLALELISQLENVLNEVRIAHDFSPIKRMLYCRYYQEQTTTDNFPKGWE